MTLTQLNTLTAPTRAEALAKCCGATAWVSALNHRFPFATPAALFADATTIWQSLTEADWREAFELLAGRKVIGKAVIRPDL